MAKAKHTTQQTLTVQRRITLGKRRVSRMRQEGHVPGVVYGKAMEPIAVTVDTKELTRALHTKAGERALVTLRVEGAKDGKASDAALEKPALVKMVQHDPVDGHILHIDFQAILLTERLKIKVPVRLTGEAVGVKQENGVLEQFLREVEIECLPTDIPESLALDVTALKIGNTLHVRDLTPPPHTAIVTDAESVVALVQAPREEKPEAEAAALTEPEVIREKKEESDEAAGETGKDAAAEGKKDDKK